MGTVSEAAHAIVLTTPNPVDRPDKFGDGSNQYAFEGPSTSGDNNPGHLYVPIVTTVQGSSADDAGWLGAGNHVDWSFDNGLPSTRTTKETYTPQIDGATLYPLNIVLNAITPRSIAFTGLPTTNANSSLGNHTVTMKIDGHDSELAYIQTFFTGNAYNHPGDHTLPNWYNYYSQTYTSPGSYSGATTATDPYAIFDANTNFWSPYSIFIRPKTYSNGDEATIPVFDTSPSSPYYVRLIGTMKVRGLLRYIYTSEHEKAHQSIFNMGGIYTQSQLDNTGHHVWPTSIDNGHNDGDHVLGSWESATAGQGGTLLHHLNPDSSDTAHAYGTAEPGDDEVLADVLALPRVFDHLASWNLDWAYPGMQWGSLYWFQKAVDAAPSFYLKFTPIVAGYPTSGNAFQPGTSTGPFQDGNYPVQTLVDIQKQYSRVLFSLP